MEISRTDLNRPFDVDPVEYPFKSNWMDWDGVAMHYLDEGKRIPVVMLHGNPTWSYLYRNVRKTLKGEFRTISPDYPGFFEHQEDMVTLLRNMRFGCEN